jgi:hypothetical protein
MISRIAHSEPLFPRACDSLAALAIAVDGRRTSNANDALSNLFSLYLSGTLAQTETRIRVARSYLQSDDPNRSALGVGMLRSALNAGRWSSSFLSYDDARPDAFGWEPRGPEFVEWFANWLDLAVEITLNSPPATASAVRKALADQFDSVWRYVPGLRQRLDEIARQLHAEVTWPEGWHALRQMLYFIERRGEGSPEGDLAGVPQLIEHMAPADLRARVRAEIARGWDLEAEDDDFTAAEIRRSERVQLLGRELAASTEELASMGRDLFEVKGRSLYSLGAGLAQGSEDREGLWPILRDLHLIDPSRSRQSNILTGFLHKLDEIDQVTAGAIRAECRATPTLRREYALFLPKNSLSTEEFNHIVEIAGESEAAACQLADIVWREERELDDDDRVRLLRAFMARADGPMLVLDALNMLGSVEKGACDVWPEALRSVGVDAITAVIEGYELNVNLDCEIAGALSYCLRGDNGADANRVTEAIIARASRRYGSIYDLEDTLGALAERSPSIFLSRVFPDGAERPFLRFRDSVRPGAFSRLDSADLVAWCTENVDRWTRLASHIPVFSHGTQGESETESISALAAALLEAAPCPGEVVEAFLQHLAPTSWSGSQAVIMERRLTVIEGLSGHHGSDVGNATARLAPGIRAQIDRVRRAEQEESREHDQRFE